LVNNLSPTCWKLNRSHADGISGRDRSARDAGKFNRFRFIVQADNAAEAERKFFRLFDGLATKDEKTRLHVIGREAVPDFFGGDGG
jgi:hypothetical protein